ncbi:MAG: efflux RND transporter periplasmic adaptor subunit [Polyangiaceae bacterium]
MSDQLLIFGAAVPMVCGAISLGFFQRSPAVPLEAPFHAQAVVSSRGRGAGDALKRVNAGEVHAHDDAKRPWVGVVIAGATAELAADVQGRVAEVFAHTGEHVNTGDKILQLDRGDATSALGIAGAELGERQADVVGAQARVEASRSKLDRLKVGAAWLSQQELETARSEARVAQAQLAAARASVEMGHARYTQQRLRAERETLVAPFAGTLMSSDVVAGDSVAAGQILARVFSEDRKVRFAITRADLPQSGTMDVLVTFPGTKLSVLAPASSFRPEVDPSAQLVFATATPPPEIARGPCWMPGAPVEVTPAPAAARQGGR